MNRCSSRKLWLLLLVTNTGLVGCTAALSPTPDDGPTDADNPEAGRWVREWNQIAVDTSGLDHTDPREGDTHTFGHQLGPTRSSRAMAIVHIAMFESVLAIAGGYESYLDLPPAEPTTSMKAAVAQSAFDTLVALYPSHRQRLAEDLERYLNNVVAGKAKEDGIAVGKLAAARILAMRATDGSNVAYDFIFSDAPGAWRVDPLNPDQRPHEPGWGRVRPFVIASGTQFRTPPPPSLGSHEYAAAYDEVRRLGGDGLTTPTERTEEQTHIGIFWAYDGMPSLCAPPRLYNQVALAVADAEQLTSIVELARYLALVNVALADTGIAAWESKYYFNFWRPVTAIREAEPGLGPTGLGDFNLMTSADPTFVPLGAPASNLGGPNFTPPFPAYPSGHAAFGGALFELLRNFFGTDDVSFSFTSDEYNGITTGLDGEVRPVKTTTYSRLSDAEEENGQSRIYLGIHWSFDKTEGIRQGNRVADYVFGRLYRPLP